MCVRETITHSPLKNFPKNQMLHSCNLFFSSPNSPISLSHHLHSSKPPPHCFSSPIKPHIQTGPKPCLAQLNTNTTIAATPLEEGPIELPPSSSIFAITDDPSPLQLTTSILLTGAITVFLFRSIRRRVKRAKELTFRSSGVKKSVTEEALESLKAIRLSSVEPGSPPSPVQALLGGITAGVIALVLYKFTTTIETALNRQTLSDSFSVRQITITIRTFVNGMCYLATFVFGLNSIGLMLYSVQLAFSSFMEGPTDKASSGAIVEQPSTNPSNKNSADKEESNGTDGDSSENTL